MVKPLAFARVERLPRPRLWEDAVKPDQALSTPDILANDVMTFGDSFTITGGRLI